MEATAVPYDSSRPLSPIERFFGIFANPRKVFEDLRARPSWLLPFLVLTIVSIGANYVMRPAVFADQSTKIEENERMSAEQKEEAIEGMQKWVMGPMGLLINAVVIPIAVLATMAIVAAVLYFGTTLLQGSETTYRRIFAMTAHISYLGVPNLLLRIPLALAKNSLKVHLSPGALLPGSMEDSVVMRILDRFDVFEIWGVALYTLGLAVICRMRVGKAASLVIPLWLVWSILVVVFSQVFRSFGM